MLQNLQNVYPQPTAADLISLDQMIMQAERENLELMNTNVLDRAVSATQWALNAR